MFCFLCCIALLFPLYYILRYIWELIPVGDLKNKPVFISGCDSGFGRQLALKLAKNGIPVFAGCLTEKGEDSLRKEGANLPGKLQTVPLDVTSDESVAKAAEIVKKSLNGKDLWAVVNNAGIFSIYGPDDWCTIDEYKRSMDVNLYGVIRVNQAFKPFVKKSKGRIVTVSSVAGRVTAACTAPYSAAKYACESYMDAIRLELYLFGVTCCILEPGAFKTPLLDEKASDSRIEQVWGKLSEETKKEYGVDFKNKFKETWNNAMEQFASTHTDYVVDNYYHAITARFPRLRYRCGWDSLLLWVPMSYLPTELGDALSRLAAKSGGRPPLVPAALRKNDRNMSDGRKNRYINRSTGRASADDHERRRRRRASAVAKRTSTTVAYLASPMFVILSAALIILALLIAFFVLRFFWELPVLPNLQHRSVFITGCDSGFGKALALRLLKDGMIVFAGCFTEKGEVELKKESHLLPGELHTVHVDITKDESVKSAVERVKMGLSGRLLWAIVNNAGIFTIYGPDSWLNISSYQKSIDVNLLGAVRVTHAFAPMLKKSGGRIVTMTSVSGRLPGVFTGPYTAAKYALEGYMDVVRLELYQYGVSVHILEPGAFKTALLDENALHDRVEHIWNRLPADIQDEYGIEYKDNFKVVWCDGVKTVASPNIHYVVDNYVHAITARFPRARYHCGWDAILFWIPMTFLPTELQDALNRFLVSLQPGKKLIPAILRKSD